jgi:hypothetical protein
MALHDPVLDSTADSTSISKRNSERELLREDVVWASFRWGYIAEMEWLSRGWTRGVFWVVLCCEKEHVDKPLELPQTRTFQEHHTPSHPLRLLYRIYRSGKALWHTVYGLPTYPRPLLVFTFLTENVILKSQIACALVGFPVWHESRNPQQEREVLRR